MTGIKLCGHIQILIDYVPEIGPFQKIIKNIFLIVNLKIYRSIKNLSLSFFCTNLPQSCPHICHGVHRNLHYG